MSEEAERQSLPWMKTVFDWEAVAAAAGAFLAALLLGWIWDPLFWVGFAAMVIALAAGRWAKRTPPDLAYGVVAPCDGVVVSVGYGDAPAALRLKGESLVRVRIASSPVSSNKLYAPMAGGVEIVSLQQGEPGQPIANRPDEEGLTRAYVTFESQGEQAGIVLTTGGLGPRIELAVDHGDVVRLGRSFGTRRLGGWCDVYLPADIRTHVWAGQTLTGGETVIAHFRSSVAEDFEDADAVYSGAAAPQPTRPEPAVADTVSAEEGAEEVAEDAVDEFFDDDYPEPDEVSAPEDPAAIFARLREAARKHGEGD
ncbi:phosphatidylserine decarboxylase [Hyphomonas sp. WL0036]|uniref:phosphatidylserine decarboxylase n=1 Tax=Hyphomonas sediminis TaxID=2866160 RepID=UPI001C7E541E|nr:phosphatidylserine decarboxylase [Hyphomonas sediminis]MBY9067215.1 phosphatidylserine decarboxylase [Hyphomonas sediminis]